MPKLRVKESSDLDTLDYGRLGFTLNKVDWLELPLGRLVSMVGNDNIEYKFSKEDEDALLNLNDGHWLILSDYFKLTGDRAAGVKKLLPTKKKAGLKNTTTKTVKETVAKTAKTVKETVL